MCENCYHEAYGAPTEITERAVIAADLIRKVYSHHVTGGNCHIVIDDWNLDDSSLVFCHREVQKDKAKGLTQKNLAEESLLIALTAMTVDERAVALALTEGILKLHG